MVQSYITLTQTVAGFNMATGTVLVSGTYYKYYTFTGNNNNSTEPKGTINFPKSTNFFYMIVGAGGSGGDGSAGGQVDKVAGFITIRRIRKLQIRVHL